MRYYPDMKTPQISQTYLTVTEAAERLMVDNATVRRWIEDGEFPGTIRTRPRVGEYRIPMDAIVRFEEARKIL